MKTLPDTARNSCSDEPRRATSPPPATSPPSPPRPAPARPIPVTYAIDRPALPLRRRVRPGGGPAGWRTSSSCSV